MSRCSTCGTGRCRSSPSTSDTIGDFNDPTYSDPVVRRWNQKIKEADAYLVITPEYNHSVPGVLKNAIDNVCVSFAFRNKPIVAVGYSGGIAGGVRAIEHLAQIAIEAELVPLRAAVVIPQVAEAFDEDGLPVNPCHRHQPRRRPRRPRLVVCRSGAGTGRRRARSRGASVSKRRRLPSTRSKTKSCDGSGGSRLIRRAGH